ncbi:MAG: nicotinate phosphoribosyltransferase [Coriobacteriales bacterium]|jgi:nicotinate phosphoribosyltransferase
MEENSALLTDLYELTMSEGYWKMGLKDARASFYMHFRNNPFEGGYTIACGLDHLAEIVDGFKFTDSDIDYLLSIKVASGEPLFDPEFVNYLRGYRLDVDIDAPLEGTVVFPYEPIVRVTGPIIDCQILEPALLNAVNFETLIATKSARVCNATKGSVAEFGLRRAQGPNGGLRASRAAVIGGCTSTSNVLAGKVFNLPVSGTHAHSWVMSFDSELEAFREFARVMPHNCILLVDTYDIEEGLKNAIIVGKEMEERGEKLLGIRIDSGDLAWGSNLARKMLDEAGLDYVKVVATNDLDEFTIASLEQQNASIDSWGVGTKLAVAYDQPALGGVYKMSAIKKSPDSPWVPKIKISAQQVKRTLPGVLDVMRYHDSNGKYVGDVVYDMSKGEPGTLMVDPFDSIKKKDFKGYEGEKILVPLARGGRSVYGKTDCMAAQQRVKDEISKLDRKYVRFLNPGVYPVGLDMKLFGTRSELLEEHSIEDGD